MTPRHQQVEPFVNLSELAEIELLIMRPMREFTSGEHRGLFCGSGFDVVVLVDGAFAFEFPAVSAGWIEVFDVETRRARVVSRPQLRGLAAGARSCPPSRSASSSQSAG